MVSISEIQRTSASRSRRWHGEDGVRQWTVLEWAGAMCGEAGEAANVAKKIRRYDLDLIGNDSADREVLRVKLVRELADTVLYAVLVAERENIDLDAAVVDTFNKKSEGVGFPERI